MITKAPAGEPARHRQGAETYTMSRFMNTKYSGLKEYTPGEQPKDTVYIKLNTNESPYPPGPGTIAAVTDAALASRLRLYSDPESAALKKALAGRYGVSSENIFVSNGSDDILNFAFMAFAEDGVMFPEVTYGFYPVFAALNGIDAVQVPMREGLSIDPDDYAGSGRMIVLANPNAPTGLSLPVIEIERMAAVDPDHVVLVDEAYVDFGGESCIGLIDKYPNVLVVRTYSKSRSLAGARLGFAVGSSGVIADFEKIKYSTNPYNVNSLTAAAGIAALAEDDYYMDNCRKVMETRGWTTAELKKLGFEVIPSSSNFIFAKSGKIGGKELYEKLRVKRILVRHFDNPLICEYNRITVGTPEEMAALIDAVSDLIGERV